MLQPKTADETEGTNDGEPSCRLKDIFDPRRNVESRSEKRQAEAKDQIAERFQPHRKALATSLDGIRHYRTLR